MNNPLYNRVRKIAISNSKSGEIRNSHFDCIRNKASVRAILKDMGYKPSNEVRPDFWRLSGAKSKPRKKIVTNARRGDESRRIVEELEAGKTVILDELVNMKRISAQRLMWKLRMRGFQIHAVKVDGELVGYKLAEH